MIGRAARRRTLGVNYGAVAPMLTKLTAQDLAHPGAVGSSTSLSNRTSLLLLRQVGTACSGHPRALLPAVRGMFRLRDDVLTRCLGNPLPDRPGPPSYGI